MLRADISQPAAFLCPLGIGQLSRYPDAPMEYVEHRPPQPPEYPIKDGRGEVVPALVPKISRNCHVSISKCQVVDVAKSRVERQMLCGSTSHLSEDGV